MENQSSKAKSDIWNKCSLIGDDDNNIISGLDFDIMMGNRSGLALGLMGAGRFWFSKSDPCRALLCGFVTTRSTVHIQVMGSSSQICKNSNAKKFHCGKAKNHHSKQDFKKNNYKVKCWGKTIVLFSV